MNFAINYVKETVKGMERISIDEILFSSREMFLTEPINSQTANDLIKQLMVLEKLDSTKEITLYINSPGGDVISGMAVYDYLRMMDSPIRTVCTGTYIPVGFLVGYTTNDLISFVAIFL